MSIGDRIKKARKAKGWTQPELADRCGWGHIQARISHYETSKRHPDIRDMAILENALGLHRGALVGANEPPQTGSIMDTQSVSDAAVSYSVKNKKDWVSIPKLNVSASMGKGLSSQYLESVVEVIIVKQEWLRRNVNASSPENLALITAYGDSMEGTFSDGDLLLIDRGVETVNIDAVYALALGDELFIKRLQRRPDGTMLMISDNAKYTPYQISNGDLTTFRVLGRVLLAWNARRL